VVKADGMVKLPWHKDAKIAGLSVELASDLLRRDLQSVIDFACLTLTAKQRKGSWALEREPFFVDVPPPGHDFTAKAST